MGFTTPIILLGLLGAAVPILVHLLRRRRPQPTVFPALALLQQVMRRYARRRRLRDALLLLVRVLLLVAIPVALAGPYCSRTVKVPASAAKDQRAVIIIDDSMSMRYRAGGRTLLSRARDRTEALLSVLPATAPVALLTVSRRGREVPNLSLDRARLRAAVRALRPTYLSTPLEEALGRAQQILVEGRDPRPRVIYVVSDFTAHAVGEKLPQPPGVLVERVDVAADVGRLANRALTVFARRTALRAGFVSLRVGVLNASARARTEKVTIYAGDRAVGTALLTVPPGRTVSKSIDVARTKLPSDARFLVARLSGDPLAADDARWLPLRPKGRVNVLLVDGDPRETRHRDELFFLEAALGAVGRGGARVRVRVIAGGDLPGADLKGVDLLALCNVATVERDVQRTLTTFVRRGGGLLVTMGDQVDVANYNAVLGDLLPARLRGVRAGGAAGRGAARIAPPSGDLGMGGALEDPATRAALASSGVRRHVLTTGGGTVLLRLEGGAPLLSENRVGAGRVLLWTTTIDRDWSDIALRPAFIPLVRGLLTRLTGRGGPRGDSQVRVGRAIRLGVERELAGLAVSAPGGRRIRVDRRRGGQAMFDETWIPGPYRVWGLTGKQWSELPGASFAVVSDPAESDLTRASARASAPGAARSSGAQVGVAQQTGLAGHFAILCLLLLFIEALLAARVLTRRRRA